MAALLLAFRFLTVIPLRGGGDVPPETIGRSVGFFPLVGAVLGGVLAGGAWVLGGVFPPQVGAALLLGVWVLLTGALHLDGFLDACDGLFGGHTPEARLHIMRDERVGAFALAGGVLLLLTKYAALSALMVPFRPAAYLLAPVLGRLAMSAAVVGFPYAREHGLGRAMKDHAGTREVALAGSTALLVSVAAAGWVGLLFLTGTLALMWGMATRVMARIPGLTGDIYGALCEVTEAAVLVAWVGLLGPGG